MTLFDYFCPTKIYFGSGRLKEAIKKENNVLQGTVMIVSTGTDLDNLGYTNKLISALELLSPAPKIVKFQNIDSNPKLSQIEKGVEFGKTEHVSCVIGFGGGSAIDAAKSIAFGVGESMKAVTDALDYGKQPSNSTLPIIAIPTTAGTGSELSRGAIITDDRKGIKTGIRGDNIQPYCAIVDPYFTEKLPILITMETGFDVLTHAIESYISTKSSQITCLFSEWVIQNVPPALYRLKEAPYHMPSRELMSYASMLMGANLANASTVLPHRLQYPIGAKTDTTHASGLCALYKAWIKYTYEFSKSKFDRICMLMSNNTCNNVEMILSSFDEFFDKIELHWSLKDLGIKKSDIDDLLISVTGDLSSDPGYAFPKVIRMIYEDSM